MSNKKRLIACLSLFAVLTLMSISWLASPGMAASTCTTPTFAPALNTSVTDYSPTSSAVGDFNNDGKTDIALAMEVDYSGFIYIYLGKGDGTFTIPMPTAAVAMPRAIIVQDFNNDGFKDLAVANVSTGT